MEYTLARAFKQKDAFGDPKAAIQAALTAGTIDKLENGLPKPGQDIVVGYVFGTATANNLITRTDPRGNVEQWEALKGNFEAISADGKTGMRAPLAYLPEHIHGQIATQLRDQGKGRDDVEGGSESLGFAFEVAVRTSDRSPAGFTWEYKPRAEARVFDPLAELRRLALPAPEAPAETGEGKEPAPADKAGKKKAA